MAMRILCERYDEKHPADLAVCLSCGEEFKLDPLEGDPEDMCLEHRCGGAVAFKYVQADKCKGCNRLGFYRAEVNAGCCSRRCMLVAEHAASLVKSACVSG